MSTATTGHPRGLYVLFFTEMWERFSYYGMRAIFFLYLTNALLMNTEDASNVYGSYTGLVYLTPLLGGYIADKYWGNRRSIFVGGILMAVGQFLMFGSGSMLGTSTAMPMMLAGLFFLILGNGFFKPNISTMVGQLYPAGDKRIDSAFTIFYMGINLGAFFSPLVCGGLGDTGNIHDFRWGFLAAGIGMVISVISFELLKNKYLVRPDGSPVGMPTSHVHVYENESNFSSDAATNRLNAPNIERPKKETPNFTTNQLAIGIGAMVAAIAVFYYAFHLDFIGSLIFGAAIGMPLLIITDKSLTSTEKQRIWVIFILAFFVIFFWSAFEQAGASLTYFADKQTDRFLGSYEVPASYFQSINPLGIIILAPLFSILWVRLGASNKEPSSPLKMALGLLLVCLGYVLIALVVKGLDPNAKVSMWWLFLLYVLHTMGELCLSPIGLSMVSKLAPLRFASLLMGTWFLANAAANKLAGTLSALIPPDGGQFATAKEKVGVDLAAILNGTVQATTEQIAQLKELGISTHYPTLLGNDITSLYEFFMVFIIMSGAAAALLFVLHRWLMKMMHGVK